ncbi:MAG: hypothetical protein P9E24_15820 [Candidatus Competibacter sp.]|nr:hypothetical protein [Candidatus Competibacter sp.]MDG4585066.1 hypothetical protein [Candidatus Competibacter sp.]
MTAAYIPHRFLSPPSWRRTLLALLGGLTLAGIGLTPIPTQAADTSACMGIRPALYAGSAPAFVRPGQEVVVHGTGLRSYRDPVVVVRDGREPGQDLRIAARVKSDGVLAFVYPADSASRLPLALRAHVEDNTIKNSPAVCAALREERGRQIVDRFYPAATDLGCRNDPVVCPAAEDHLRSMTGITLNLIPSATPVGRVASLEIDNPPGMASPFCNAQPVVSDVAAFFDAGPDGVTSGFSKVSMRQPASTGRARTLPGEPSDEVAAPAGAKLVVVARFQSCARDAPQFVAAHFAVYGSAESPMIEPVKLMAGDDSESAGSASAPRQGVVLSGEIQNQKIRLASADSVEGSVAGLVTQGADSTARGALLRFNFRAPVESR